MQVTYFLSAHHGVASADTIDLTKAIPEPRIGRDKRRLPAWSPAIFVGARRKNAAVEGFTCVVFDLDHMDYPSYEVMKKELDRSCFDWWLHSTHSHQPVAPFNKNEPPVDLCYRLIFPFSQPVQPPRWREVKEYLRGLFPFHNDPQTEDLARIYFVPAKARADAPYYWEHHEGLLVDIVHKAEGICERNWIDLAYEGKVFCSKGNRDNRLLELSAHAINKFGMDSDAILRALTPALKALGTDEHGKTWLEIFEDKLARDLVARMKTEAPYAALRPEKRPIAPPPPPGGLERLIIKRDHRGWVWDGEEQQYRGPFDISDLLAAFRRYSLRVEGVTLLSDLRKKTLNQILEDYSTLPEAITYSLSEPVSRYIEETSTFKIAKCPPRVSEAKEDPEIAQWLLLLGGEEYEALLDWCAALPMIDRPSRLLYFDGPPACGKNLFAASAARLWSEEGPERLSEALGHFNVALLRCPLLLADESVPTEKDTSSKIRALITAQHHTINAKNAQPMTLEGCARVLLAANNDKLLRFAEALTRHDQEGIIDRMLYINPDREAADYLRSLGGREHVDKWRAEDRFVKHCRYLAQVRPLDRNARFLGRASSDAFSTKLAATIPVVKDLLQYVCAFLAETKRGESPHCRVDAVAHSVHVDTHFFRDQNFWRMLSMSIRPPTPSEIGEALSSVAACTHSDEGDTWELTESLILFKAKDMGLERKMKKVLGV